MKEIKEWIEKNNLDVKWVNDIVFTLDSKDYCIISPKQGKIFDQEFNLIFNEKELEQILIEYWCFQFGDQVYYSSTKSDRTELNLLKHIGKAKDQSGFSFLGIHGAYELGSGSKLADSWCKKASFLGITALGICETHTLAGAIKFQQEANKAGIKSIIGETIKILGEEGEYKVKLYVKNQLGWENLLRIHKRLNVDNLSTHVEQEFLIENLKGLYLVFQADVILTDKILLAFEAARDEERYFQFDPVKYASDKRDLHCLNCLKNYLDNYQGLLKLALICDSYYLDQEDHRVKKILSFIAKSQFEYQSTDQYFKSLEDVAQETLEMFTTKGEDYAYEILQKSLDGLQEIVDGCDFKIKTGEIHMPKYVMTEEEASKFATNEDLFWHLIETGLAKKESEGKDIQKYYERVEREADILTRGGFIDYFLIIRDIINWAEANNIMVGPGRGSISGSLIALFTNLTKVDALEYDLIFERFLNASRIGKGLPDVDCDFSVEGRPLVKKYIQERFGEANVAAIGTYNALKTKAAFRDLLRFHGEQPQIINYYAAMMEKSDDDYASLFHAIVGAEKFKEFINTHSEAVNDVPLILGQPKSASIHASGVLITPKIDKEERKMDIWDWFPCKISDGVLISEWEGVQLDDAGFLKADILGLEQLDKLTAMLKLIPEKIDLNKIDLEDEGVYKLFQKGLTQDVFQFGTDGLSAYCKEAKPTSIMELATINALYRPGAMDSGAHIDYVKIKNGRKEPEYDWGTEEILKPTFGLYIFQESAIFIVQKVGGLSLADGDGVRKAIGKKIADKMASYKTQFIEGAIKNGCPQFEAEKIWHKIEVFSGYGFNASHAVAYSMIGYQTQWIKRHYPLQFWTVSLQFAKDDEIPKRVSEMRKFEEIRIAPPDINKSREVFYTDWETNTIYWSLSRIAQVGEVALKAIMEEREARGQFFSIEEFVNRVKEKGGVNRRVVQHLILSGCFDELYQIEKTTQRLKLLQEWSQCYNCELSNEFNDHKVNTEFFWYKLQRDLSGSGYYDYTGYETPSRNEWAGHDGAGPDEINSSEYEGAPVVVSGLITQAIRRKTKKGEMGKVILDHNNDLIDLIFWNAQWEGVRKQIEENIGNAITVNGKVGYDSHNKKNCVYSTDQTVIEIF